MKHLIKVKHSKGKELIVTQYVSQGKSRSTRFTLFPYTFLLSRCSVRLNSSVCNQCYVDAVFGDVCVEDATFENYLMSLLHTKEEK